MSILKRQKKFINPNKTKRTFLFEISISQQFNCGNFYQRLFILFPGQLFECKPLTMNTWPAIGVFEIVNFGALISK